MHNGLRAKLAHTGFPVKMVRWTSEFLDQRKSYIFIDSVRSNWFVSEAALRQGSLLSPVLFAIYIADSVPMSEGGGCVTSSYANDMLMLMLFGRTALTSISRTKAARLVPPDLELVVPTAVEAQPT